MVNAGHLPDTVAPANAFYVATELLGRPGDYKHMRACYGLSVCTFIGVVVSLFTRPESAERQRGLVWGTIADALRGDETTFDTIVTSVRLENPVVVEPVD